MVPDVPADLEVRREELRRPVDLLLQRLVAVVPEPFPGQDLRVLEQQSQEGDQAAVARINASGAKLLFIGIGSPKQEIFAHAHRNSIQAVQLCVGAAFDFHAGAKKMAPAWMQKRGLEWLFRLAREPKRLFWRYAVTNPLAIFLLLTRTNALPAENHAPLTAEVRAAA